MITISIDVSLLDKSRFKRVARKNGKEGVFCDLVLIETPQGKYGDFMVKQSVTKEERAAKKEMPFLGNGKDWRRGDGVAARGPDRVNNQPAQPSGDDEVPF